MPTWATSARQPVRIAWFALVWPALRAQLFRPGRAAARITGNDLPHALYRAGPAAAAALDGDAGDRRDRHRLTGGDLRGLLDGAPGGAARSAAAHPGAADLRARAGADLRAGRQLAGVHRGDRVRLGFGSSDALAGAYGAAVVGTMFVTTILGSFVAATQWSWPKWRSALLFGLLLVVDSIFVAGNLTKVPTGGWIPLTLGGDAVHGLHDLAQRAAGAARRAREDGRAAHASCRS